MTVVPERTGLRATRKDRALIEAVTVAEELAWSTSHLTVSSSRAARRKWRGPLHSRLTRPGPTRSASRTLRLMTSSSTSPHELSLAAVSKDRELTLSLGGPENQETWVRADVSALDLGNMLLSAGPGVVERPLKGTVHILAIPFVNSATPTPRSDDHTVIRHNLRPTGIP
jgi:hypothetical protein